MLRALTRRGLDAHDMSAVRAIMREAVANDYRFQAIVLGIVRSVPFTMRTAQTQQVARSN